MKRKLYFSLFPKKCPGCGTLTTLEELFCEACAEKLPRIPAERCEYCGAGKEDCACRQQHEKYDSVLAPFYYEGPAKKAMLRLKEYPIYAAPLARECVAVMREYYASYTFDLVTSVPMAKSKQKQKGFNQSERLAREIAALCALPYADCLTVLYDTPAQHSMDYYSRSANVRGIYEVTDESAVKGKHILLIDDIKTTGATLSECALMLKLAGAASVETLVAALDRKQQSKGE